MKNDVLFISSWGKYQNIEGLDKIRQQTRVRVAKHRENKALSIEEKDCNVTVTLRNATEENKNRIEENIKDIHHHFLPSEEKKQEQDVEKNKGIEDEERFF